MRLLLTINTECGKEKAVRTCCQEQDNCLKKTHFLIMKEMSLALRDIQVYLSRKVFYRFIKTKEVLIHTLETLNVLEYRLGFCSFLCPRTPGCPCNRSRKGTVKKWPEEIRSIRRVVCADTWGAFHLFSVLNTPSLCADLCILFMRV